MVASRRALVFVGCGAGPLPAQPRRLFRERGPRGGPRSGSPGCSPTRWTTFRPTTTRDGGRALTTIFATALANLGDTPETLRESVSFFERALAWRTSQREIARGVSLHNLGRALHRWADLEPERSRELLERSAAAFAEAVEIRGRHGLSEGRALSLFQSGLALEALGRPAAAREVLESAAEEFERLGKAESAAIALARANAHASASAPDPDPDPAIE